MAKAIFISHVPLFPLIGGDRIRIAQSLRLLSEVYDVDVVYLTNNKTNELIKDNIFAIKSEKAFYSPKIIRFLRASRTLFNRKSFFENLYLNNNLKKYIDSVYHNYDMLFCASPVSAQYVMNLSHPVKVLDMTDSLTLNCLNQILNAKGFFKKWFLNIDMNRMRKYETLCKKNFDSVAYISEVDKHFIDSYNDHAHIVGNYIDLHSGQISKFDFSNKLIVFVGKMDYEPNISATSFFAKEIFPLIKRQIPDIKFTIVGSNPTPAIKKLEKIEGVKVTGYVESIEPWFEQASIIVAPMISGSGVQNKILQALSKGCCVVTTPIGNEGLEELGNVLDVIEPSPILWANHIIDIFKDPSIIFEKAKNAPAAVEKVFGIDTVRKQFHDFINFAH